MYRISAVGAFLFLAFTTGAAAQTVLVTAEFQAARHDWPQQSGGLEIRWARVTLGGDIMVCGAIRHINARARKANRGLLRKAWVRAGSDKGPFVLRDLSYFSDIRSGDFVGAQAPCRPIDQTGSHQELHLGFDAHSGYDAHMDMF